MATATPRFLKTTRTVNKPTEVPDGITLRLTPEETVALGIVCGHIAGSPAASPRGFLSNIGSALGHTVYGVASSHDENVTFTGQEYHRIHFTARGMDEVIRLVKEAHDRFRR